MASRGLAETNQLRKNLEDQMERLVQQLADLEECKDSLEQDEYEESRSDTLDQLKELNESLSKMMSGDMTLVDQLGSMQLALQAAISGAFRTPAVIRMFAKREPDHLRERLSDIDRNLKLGKTEVECFINEKVEILRLLQQLGDKLSINEIKFLEERKINLVPDGKHFEKVSEESGSVEDALVMAGSEARSVRLK